MKETLQAIIQKVVEAYARKKGLALPDGFEVELALSQDASHGDWSTPVAFRLARTLKEKPTRIAEELVTDLKQEFEKGGGAQKGWARSEVAGGGYLNFFISASKLAELLIQIHREDRDFGKSQIGQGKKVLIEFVSANPTGPLTVAHGRQAVVGDSLARILAAVGFQVTREYYLNDTGRQIQLLGESLWARYQGLFGREAVIPEEGYQGEYLRAIAERLREKRGDALLKRIAPESIQECTRFAVEEILQGIREDLQAIRVEFGSYASELAIREKKRVEKVIDFLRGKDLVYEEEGALWFRATRFGDDKDRVLRKGTGDYTYLAPDMAYHRQKFERGYERLINLWGPDHHGYIPRLRAACEALGHPAEQLTVLIVQLVTLYRKGEPVRMSTRAGEFVTLRELFEEVGVDATRFFFLLRRVESHLDFDLDLAKTQSDENPVYYLQYAHARIASILKFAERKITPKVNLARLGASEEVKLIKKLQEFPEVVLSAAEGLEPYRLVESLREVAAQFHKFYTLHRVVTEDKELTAARLLLADGVRIVLRNGLGLLGVLAPETM